MADSEALSTVYLAISNIPVALRSADLRNYFSQFIESGGFQCFHYRHRPEVLRETEVSEDTVCSDGEEGSSKCSEADRVTLPVNGSKSSEADRVTLPVNGSKSSEADGVTLPVNSSKSSEADRVTLPVKKQAVKTCCCVASLRAKDADRLVRMYAGNHWIDPKGNWLASRCVIKRVKVSHDHDDGSFPYKSKHEQRHRVSLTERFTEADLKSLSELNPPALMQNGNVGTPVKVFLQLIQSCRLPPRLIRKLGLTFPKTSSNRRYGNVPFHYRDTWTLPATEETVLTAAGHEISGPGTLAAPFSRRRKLFDHAATTETDEPQKEEEEEEEDAQSNADDDDDWCEEWERHEALHEDVTSQERCKERLFEEEIELKWEKGGSGLVFYTDAQYWQEEEGDFDEQTTDDWDVDMSVYYDKDGGDMDARDYVRMRYEKRLREGLEDRSGHSQLDTVIGSFERFSKGFGRRLMERQGWKDGEGLGHSQVGIPDALEGEGQHPNCKRGFGYHGEKLVLQPVKKARTDFHITTVYDKPKDIDGGDTLLRRQPNTSMKYRGWQPGGTIGPRR
ncbi:G patch domain-containing protein 3 [Anarhichas minor]|uniref:G patch domain-containing protein 3 n=1 Tax=Anarhichas minor TaxID=65739 RepID=UPI003F73EE98